MKQTEKTFKCFLHCAGGTEDSNFDYEQCEGNLITRRSIYGAEMRSCTKAWNEANNFLGWPKILREERL